MKPSTNFLANILEKTNLLLGVALFLTAILFVTNLDIQTSKTLIYIPYQ